MARIGDRYEIFGVEYIVCPIMKGRRIDAYIMHSNGKEFIITASEFNEVEKKYIRGRNY